MTCFITSCNRTRTLNFKLYAHKSMLCIIVISKIKTKCNNLNISRKKLGLDYINANVRIRQRYINVSNLLHVNKCIMKPKFSGLVIINNRNTFCN